ncbi:hypothetical protein KAR91_72085 [Candidatus Pacearchaeota archaeon]|nr:hypothetical protein [Candidatus Pacearchaeota archaeon]
MTSMIGGHLKDIPKPHLRKWADAQPMMLGLNRWEQKQPPTNEKRRITISFSSYVGTAAINATHYIVRIEEETNPIWNSDTEQWQNPWDYDSSDDDIVFREEFTLATRAVDWAKIMVDEHFSGDEYEVDWSSLELFSETYQLTNTHHLYAREGD